MTLPGVTINETDNALGVLSATDGRLLAVVGTSTKGPLNTPATYARAKDLAADFGDGEGPEFCAYYIDRYSRPVLFVRADTSNAAAVSTVTHDADGTSVVTIANGATPIDNYELALEFLTAGTVGTAGITYRVSYDNGRNWSPTRALGTANSIVLAEGVTFALAAGTVVAGDMHTARATAESWSSADLTAALAPLRVTHVDFGLVHFVGGVIDASTFDVADTVRSFTNGKHAWIGNTRLPNVGETEAQYQTALAALSNAKATKDAMVFMGGSKATSAISGRSYQRPASWCPAARQASVSEEVNIADLNLGPLPGCSIRDANGNPDEHDERINPGGDAMRFATLTTQPRRQGVYVTLPRVFAPTGSDFEIMPNRLVMNVAYEALYDYLLSRLHRPIIVSRATGRILASEAVEITLGANAVLSAKLLTKPKASDAFFTLSRTDNLLSTHTLTCGAKILPLAYPRYINLDLSFTNPAMQLQAV